MIDAHRSSLGCPLLAAACALGLACGDQASHGGGGSQPAAPSPSASPPGSPQPPATPRPGPASGIAVSFMLDPRLQGGTYGGDVWVSPTTYVGATAQVTVQARAVVVDANGTPTNDVPEWTASDPDMIAVTPARAAEVTIAVQRAGVSRLDVTSPGLSKELVVNATGSAGAVVQVLISQ
jgi:hypothetical protein